MYITNSLVPHYSTKLIATPYVGIDLYYSTFKYIYYYLYLVIFM
ncbi:hypothetical protein BCAH1134_C0243 (plasmid) [Bacillus cereus AH1134]|nr:hypothetical protein BCAH1134_C0243 [Bacillus cereus AH1134]